MKVGRAVGEDVAGGDLPDAGEGVELLEGGGVEVEGWTGSHPGSRRAWGEGWGGVAGTRDPDLFAVGEPAGEVDGVEVGAGGHARGPDGVVDPAAGGQADQPGRRTRPATCTATRSLGPGRRGRVGRRPGQGLVRRRDRTLAGRGAGRLGVALAHTIPAPSSARASSATATRWRPAASTARSRAPRPRAAGRMAAVATWPSSELTTLAADEPSHIDRRLVRAVHPHGTWGAGRTKLGGDPEWAASPSGVGLSCSSSKA